MTYRQLLASNADFRRLWLGQVVSEIGDWLNNIAVLALAIQLAEGRSVGLAIAVYAVARHLPLFVFGPVAGVVVDRFDRRRVMIAADIVRAFLALGFIAAGRLASLPVIYAVGAALFSVSAFFNAAKRASIPNLVEGTEELLSANSLSASTTAATIAVGSALGGVVATALGRDTVFVLNAVTFLASAEMIRRIRKAVSKKKEALSAKDELKFELADFKAEGVQTASSLLPSVLRRAAGEFREGLRYVRRDALLSGVFIVAAGWGLGNGAARALYSIFGARLGEQEVIEVGRGGSRLYRATDGLRHLCLVRGDGARRGARRSARAPLQPRGRGGARLADGPLALSRRLRARALQPDAEPLGRGVGAGRARDELRHLVDGAADDHDEADGGRLRRSRLRVLRDS